MVYEVLNVGKENAMSTEELVKTCNLGSKQKLKERVRMERIDGKLICSTTTCGGGYYIPKNREEIIDFIDSMTKRANNIYKTIKSAREYLKQCEGQTVLKEPEGAVSVGKKENNAV